LVWAIYSVVGRDLMTDYSPLVVTTYATVLGVLMLLPAVALEPAATRSILSDPRAVGLMGFLGVFGSALGFLWYAQALARIGTVGTSAYMNLTPVFGVGTAVLVLGERASPAVLSGGLLVLAGLALVNWPQAAHAGVCSPSRRSGVRNAG
jgi:drug/metabolite transporter (DMT)-like permease